MVDDSSRIQGNPTRTILQTTTKSLLLTPDQEKYKITRGLNVGRSPLQCTRHTNVGLLDSGATFHVTANNEWFTNYSIGASSTVKLGNGQEYAITGIREVPIQLPNSNTITLHQVQHVPELKRSLVSIGMLVEDGYKTTLNESTWMIN